MPSTCRCTSFLAQLQMHVVLDLGLWVARMPLPLSLRTFSPQTSLMLQHPLGVYPAAMMSMRHARRRIACAHLLLWQLCFQDSECVLCCRTGLPELFLTASLPCHGSQTGCHRSKGSRALTNSSSVCRGSQAWSQQPWRHPKPSHPPAMLSVSTG